MFSKLKFLSAKMADVVRAIQSFFAINERLWRYLKSHWMSRLIGPIFLISATFGAIDAIKNIKKPGNKSFDKIFALISLSLFQITLFIGIVISPIAVFYGATSLVFYTPMWVIIALVINTFYLLAQLVNHALRAYSHQEYKAKQLNQLSAFMFLQKGVACALMTTVLIMVQLSALNTLSLSIIAAISTLSSILCLTYELFKDKVEPRQQQKEILVVEDEIKKPKDNQITNRKSLFAHVNRVAQVKKNHGQASKQYLLNELAIKIATLEKQPKSTKRNQKINMLKGLWAGLTTNEKIFSKDEILNLYPLAFQSLSIFTGKSDVEDLYDACFYFQETTNELIKSQHAQVPF